MSIEELEVLRKKARNGIIKGFLISFIIAIVIFIISNSLFFPIFIITFGTIVSYLTNMKKIRQFTLAFKETYVLKALKSVFTDLIYKPESGLNESIIRNTGMMYMGDRYTSNDFISAKYKNINVVQADIHIEEEHETTDSDGTTTRTWVTIFKGRWMIFDFNKLFKANIQVSQKGFGNAQSEHDAFYILTPSLMEKIKKLTSNISGKLLFCFIDNKLHIGIQNNKDSFEHGIFTKINEENVTKEIAQDIKLITNFVDELSLDNDLFRREV